MVVRSKAGSSIIDSNSPLTPSKSMLSNSYRFYKNRHFFAHCFQNMEKNVAYRLQSKTRIEETKLILTKSKEGDVLWEQK
ncbi:hypothetical protein [Komagataeibacter kakiaceti]|uniref:hypothetical protein n=1 Tax=Komagataeibacter kakiaceti TaxID=943261 RepID=UPI001A7EE5C5|nr:hypothetical protein [Komagataeibacter kakiaceti]